jgi:hypothetical protein
MTTAGVLRKPERTWESKSKAAERIKLLIPVQNATYGKKFVHKLFSGATIDQQEENRASMRAEEYHSNPHGAPVYFTGKYLKPGKRRNLGSANHTN